MWDVQAVRTEGLFNLSSQLGLKLGWRSWCFPVPQHSFFPWLFSLLLPFPHAEKSQLCTYCRSLLKNNFKPSWPESRGSLRFSWVFLKWINSVNKAYTHRKMSFLLKAKVSEIEVSGAPRSDHTAVVTHPHTDQQRTLWKKPQISSKPTMWSFGDSVQDYPPSSRAKTAS